MKQKLFTRVPKELTGLEAEIAELKERIQELEQENRFYEDVLDEINTLSRY